MPQLGICKTKRLMLPSTASLTDVSQQAWVDVKEDLTIGELADFEAEDDTNKRGFLALSYFIADWNFTEDGTDNTPKLAIIPDNIRKMTKEDFNFITEQWTILIAGVEQGALKNDEKKASTVVSSATENLTETSPVTSIPIV